ncbi:hypothetical protein [Streptodolium elevatio]|uniref:Lipoprotein n=1 Tax=Streptodolium elevatio TaxID=3157996 RepID=A0ABV3DJ08_9ACTN
MSAQRFLAAFLLAAAVAAFGSAAIACGEDAAPGEGGGASHHRVAPGVPSGYLF